MSDLPGYDRWKTTEPVDPTRVVDKTASFSGMVAQCSCTTARRDQWCPVHGRDPDDEYEKRRERKWDRG